MRPKMLEHDDCGRTIVKTHRGWIRYLDGAIAVTRPFKYRTHKLEDEGCVAYIAYVDDEDLRGAPICMSGENARDALKQLREHVKDLFWILWGLTPKELGSAPLAQKRFLESVLREKDV